MDFPEKRCYSYCTVIKGDFLIMKYNTKKIGSLIKKERKKQGLTQKDMALVCGSGERFIVDLEKGKPTCEFSKVLEVIQCLGIEIELKTPSLLRSHHKQDKKKA